MLYIIIIALFVLLLLVAIKWAQSAREVRQLKVEMKVAAATTISHDAAIYQSDRRFQAGIERGYTDGLLAAEKVATDALVKGRAPIVAIRALRNATK
jgi:hypothetical protein